MSCYKTKANKVTKGSARTLVPYVKGPSETTGMNDFYDCSDYDCKNYPKRYPCPHPTFLCEPYEGQGAAVAFPNANYCSTIYNPTSDEYMCSCNGLFTATCTKLDAVQTCHAGADYPEILHTGCDVPMNSEKSSAKRYSTSCTMSSCPSAPLSTLFKSAR